MTALAPVERHTVDVPGGRLSLVLHRPGAGAAVPCVVACHGLGASKESDKYVTLGSALPAAGLALARFDFRGCGESSGREEDTTIATRIEDVETVLARLAEHRSLSGAFGLLGSSLGGFVAVHVAARAAERIGAVVTWNAPSDLRRLAAEGRRDGGGLGVPFLQELATRQLDTTPAGVARHLVVHGDADDVVPVHHGGVLHARAAKPSEFVVVPGGDHRLTDPAHRGHAIAISVAWLRRFVGRDATISYLARPQLVNGERP